MGWMAGGQCIYNHSIETTCMSFYLLALACESFHLLVCSESPFNMSVGLCVQLLKWLHYQLVPQLVHPFAVLAPACQLQLHSDLNILSSIKGLKCIYDKGCMKTFIRISV